MNEMRPKSAADVLRPLRRRAIAAWVGWGLSAGFLWVQHVSQVLHPYAVPWLLLLAFTFAAALGALLRGSWRLLRGPRRPAALAWALAGGVPAALWLALAGYGFHQWGKRQVPHNLPSSLAQMAAASLMETQARLTYPHRLESQRLVMFYDDRVTDPEGDIQKMDRHVATMEEETGLPLRTKIYWVRGELLGLSRLSLLGLALGSWQGPASGLDRHELAHAVLYQHYSPDTDPPMLLVEGWAESQSQDDRTLAGQALSHRRFLAEWGRTWAGLSDSQRDEMARSFVSPEGLSRLLERASRGGQASSSLRELTDSFWYHHDNGPVYPVGGAFVGFLLREYGTRRFLDLYFACRPGTFEAECRRVYGAELEALEEWFWEDAERLAGTP
jgi:hypothetical protein